MVKRFSLVFFKFLCLLNLLTHLPAECTLEPDGTVFVACGGSETFICRKNNIPLQWTIEGLKGIDISGPFLARKEFEASKNRRITTNDTGEDTQKGVSFITISGFTVSDKGGIIRCINANDNNTIGNATISIPLQPPTDVIATVGSCHDVTLQWTQPSEPNDLTTLVNCTPPGCTACTTSPCNITGLTPSTDYNFTVTFNSGECGTISSTIARRTEALPSPTNVTATVGSCHHVTLQWTQPSEPDDLNASVSCTPSSPGCTACTTSPCTVTGLTSSTDYNFTVTFNSGKCGTTSSAIAGRTEALPSPTNLTATVGSCHVVTLQWTQPSEPDDINASVSCTPSSSGCAECTTSPCTITGLTPSTDYIFTVTFNSGKCGTISSTIAGRTEDLQPLQHSTNVAVVRVSSNSVTLQWDPPSEPNNITTSVSCSSPSPGCAECTTSPCTITGLAQDTEYTFNVTLNDGNCKTSTNTTSSRTKVVATVEFLKNLTEGFNEASLETRLNRSLAIAERLTNIEINTTDGENVQEIVEDVTNILKEIIKARQDGKNVSSYTPEEEDALNKNMVSTFGILLSDDVVTSVENDTDPSTPTNRSSVVVGVVDTVESLGIVVASSNDTRSNVTYQSGNLTMKVEVEKTNGTEFEVELDSVMVSVGAQNDTALVVASYGYLGSVLPVEDMNGDVDSKVISLQLVNRSNGEAVQPTSPGDEYPVKIEFDDVMLTENSSCRFYKDEKDGTGAVWSSEGVETVNCSSGVCCKSNHLTNFAVLVNVGNVQHSPVIETALLALSYIGCGLSIICLIITIIALIIFRYKGQKTPVNFVHINLSVVLLAALVIFVGASYPLRHEFIPCAIVTGILHYLFLAVFSWMLCEGVMLYLMLVKVFSTLSKKLWFFLMLGYGLPVIPVVVTAGVRHNNYVNRLGCWLSSDIHYGTIWGFAAPVVVIMLINLVFLVLAIVQLCKSQKISSVRETSNTRVALNSVRAAILLLPLLGLTWVFGFITFDVQTKSDTAWEVIPLIFQIIFILLNSTQGVMIFVFYVLRNEKVLPLWKKCFIKCCPCCKARLDAATSSKSRTDTVQLGKFTSTSGAVSNTDHSVSAHNGNGVKDANSVAPVPDVEFSPGDPLILSNSEMKQTSPM